MRLLWVRGRQLSATKLQTSAPRADDTGVRDGSAIIVWVLEAVSGAVT